MNKHSFRGDEYGDISKITWWGGGKSISYLGGRGVIGEIWDGLNIRGGERFSVLPLSFYSDIAFNWFQTDNKLIAFCFGELHCVSTMGTFPHNIKGLSIILSLDKCHRLQPSPAPATKRKFQKMSIRDYFTILCLQMQITLLVYSSYTWHFNNYSKNSFPFWSQIKTLQLFRAISELRNLEVLNLAMCTGVTITGMCSLVKGGKHHR